MQLDVSGGGDNSQYIVSGSYLKQDGLIQNSSYDRYNLRTAVNSTLSKYVKVGTNANLSYAKTRQVGTSGDGFGDGDLMCVMCGAAVTFGGMLLTDRSAQESSAA